MREDVSCFFTWCYDQMERECLEKGILALGKWAYTQIKQVKKGDLGFMLNVDSDEVVGIFEVMGPGRLDIDADTWGGSYPAQVPVRHLGELLRIQNASKKLSKIIDFRTTKNNWKVPTKVIYDPEITKQLLVIFNSLRSETYFPESHEEYQIKEKSRHSVHSSNLLKLLHELIEFVNSSNHSFEKNFVPYLITHPIPFFGELENAEIITVGVNPSCSEFTQERAWSDKFTGDYLNNRLRNYFNNDIRYHEWFDCWELALNRLDASYRKNTAHRKTAAHLDLSPRATIAMSKIPDEELFMGMLVKDFSWFLRFLQHARRCKLLLLAGTISINRRNSSWMGLDDFFLEMRSFHDISISNYQEKDPAPAETSSFNITTGSLCLPAFFCSMSPSNRNHSELLVKRIEQHQVYLKKILADHF